MHCKYCGSSLSNLSNLCPNCGRLISNEQQKIKKDMNGYNNPYVQRLNELNKKEYETNNKANNNIKGIVIIIGTILLISLIAIVILLNNR